MPAVIAAIALNPVFLRLLKLSNQKPALRCLKMAKIRALRDGAKKKGRISPFSSRSAAHPDG
jgi:hypothetical protein